MEEAKFDLTPIGQTVWEDRYALKDENGKLVEKTILDTFRRVAKYVASKEKDPKKWEKKFYDLMARKYFCPGGRILAHSGTNYSQLLNCYVVPFEDDSLESIMDAAKAVATIQKGGGGTGLNYSTLRPSGCYIKGVNGRSCGVIGFIDMLSVISGVIEQGGSRRGANLGLLEIGHPDVWDFISYKSEHNWEVMRDFIDVKDEEKWAYFKYDNPYKLQMYNVSIGINDEFIEALKKDSFWPLMWKDKEWELYTVVYRKMGKGTYVDKSFEVTADCLETAIWKVKRRVPYPKAGDKFDVSSKRKIKASEIWDRIAFNAWADGCPGLLNMSTIRKMHNLEYSNPIISTNPCGELPLGKWGACLLGSIILPSFVKTYQDKNEIDFNLLKDTVHTAVRMLDDVHDVCDYPLPESKKVGLAERKIGLGTMGIHDMLIALHLDYDSDAGRDFTWKVLSFIRDEAYIASTELAKEKGSFPVYKEDKFLESGFIKTLPQHIVDKIKENGSRCGVLLSQAPTGTIGTMYNSSTGCEPWFALSFQRNTRLGSYEDGCPAFIQWKKENVGGPIPSYFKTAQEIKPEDHLKMLILFSKAMDCATSKTINMPNSAPIDEIKSLFLEAMEKGVKGITIFRDGSKEGVLVAKKKEPEEKTKEIKKAEEEVMPVLRDPRVAPKTRGNRTLGATTRVHMQDHNLYVTVNKNSSGDLVEVFATVGENKNEENKEKDSDHTSGVEDSWAEALGKIISLALRAGVDSKSIIRNLKNIPSDKPVFQTIGEIESSELIPSPPHAIARVIEEESKYVYVNLTKIENVDVLRKCKYCSSTNVKPGPSGCLDCLDCGKSGCGS